MAHPEVVPGFKDAYNDRASDIQDEDSVYYTVVATAGTNNDWAAYYGFGTPDKVAKSGEKVPQAIAEGLFPIMVNTGRTYRL